MRHTKGAGALRRSVRWRRLTLSLAAAAAVALATPAQSAQAATGSAPGAATPTGKATAAPSGKQDSKPAAGSAEGPGGQKADSNADSKAKDAAQRSQDSAAAQAKATGKPVEVAALTSETLKVVANPNGTFTATSDAHPVRVKKGGAWTAIDTTLAKNADGGYSPKASLAGVSFSAGGSGPAVTMQAPDGKSSISVTFPMPLPAPRISGNAAVYPDVLPGVDLRLAASGDAYTEVLVVHDAQAAANPALAALRTHTHAKGLTLKQAGDHGLSGVDKDGKELLHAPQPTMWDSANGPSGPAPTADDAGSGVVTVLPTTVTPTAAAQQRAATTAPGAPAADESDADVTLAPPADALTGGKVVYPLFIDPWFSYGRQNWLNVSNRGAANWNPNDVARVGLCDFGGANPCPYPYATWRAYFAMDTHFLTMGNGTHATVSSADFYITQTWNGANGCTPTPVDLYSSGGIWNGATWPGPIQSYVDEKSSGGGNGCGSQGLDFNAQSVAQSAADYGWSTSTFALRSPNESDDHQWKKFDNGASLAVTYAYPPNQAYNWGLSHAVTCNGTTYTADGWPAFSAYGSDNNPQPLNVNLWFEMYAGGDDNATNRLSWNTSGVTVASGNAGSWTENYGDLGASKNWQFRVNTDNGTGLWGGWTGWYRFTSMHEDLSGLQPPISSFDFPKDQYGNAQWGAPQGYGQLSIGNGGNGNIVGYAYAFDSGGAVNSITIPDCGYQSALGATGVVADAGGAATLPIPTTLAPGHHTVYVKGFDAAHNMTGIGSYEFLVSPAYGVSALAHTPVTGSVTNPFLGRCLDDQNRSLADSAVVDLYTCNGSPAQTWTLTADGSLTTGDPAGGIYCLDAYNNGTANGTKIQLFTCNGGANQKWRPQRDANNNWQLVNPVSGRCLDDPWASTTVTSQFQLYDCNSTFAQTWSIDLNPNRFNGPNLVAAATSVGGQTATAVGAPNPNVQKNLTSGPVPFAGNQQLIWWGTGADSATQHVTLTIPFTTPIEADYALGVKLTKATDYGQLTFSVDGTPLTPAALQNGVFDGFTASCCTAQYVPLGGMHLGAAAPHQLTITVVGRNLANTAASPKGFGLGLDFLQASPVNNVVTSSFAASMNNHGISDDTAASTANLDYAYAPAATDAGTTGTGRALSGPALAAAGIGAGTSLTLDGINFTMPTPNNLGNDNTVALGQTVTLDPAQQIKANAIGLLVASTCGAVPQSGATIQYLGGLTSPPPVTPSVESWTDGATGTAAYLPSYYDLPGGIKSTAPARVYLMVLPANPMAPLASVTLPYFGTSMTPGSCPNALHVLAIGVRPQATGNGVNWLGSWAAVPDGGTALPAGGGTTGQTLREVVHPTFLGTGTTANPVQTRIKLSNRFGTAPLVIGGASVAAQTTAGAAATGPASALKFGGQAGITIAPGAAAYSDPLPLPDTSTGNGNLVVNVFLATAGATVATHTGATNPGYLAAGNQSTETAGSAATWATPLNAWYIVSGVDITSTANNQATVAVLGDQNTAKGAPATWVDDLQAANNTAGGVPQGFVNVSSGNPAKPATAAGTANSLNQRLAGWWRLADGGGTTAVDQLGVSNLTMTGAGWNGVDHPTTTTGSATFNGTGSYGVAGTGAVIDTSQSFTLAAWAKLGSQYPAGNREVLAVEGTTTSSAMVGFNGDTKTWWVSMPSADATNPGGTTVTAPANSAQLNAWTHLAAVYDAGTKTVKLYVNGLLVASRSATGFKATGPLTIGRSIWNGNQTDYWNGGIADAQVFQQALSAAEVTVVANGSGADGQSGAALNAGVLSEPNIETAIVALGANDVLHGDTAAVIEGNVQSLISDLKYGIAQYQAPNGSAVVNVVVATIPPLGLAPGSAKEQVREQFNNDVVANSTNWGAASYIDPATAVATSGTATAVKAADLTNGSPNAQYYLDIATDAAQKEYYSWGANAYNPSSVTAALNVHPTGTAKLAMVADASTSTVAAGNTLSNYTFDFGDGSAPVSQATATATHAYAKAGRYPVKVTVTSSPAGATSTKTTYVTVAAKLHDFNGTGTDGAMALYNYGNGTSGAFAFDSTNGTSFNVNPKVIPNDPTLDWTKAQLVTGDFTGHGKADIGVFYDTGNCTAAFYVYPSLGNDSFGPRQTFWAQTNVNWFCWVNSKLVAADLNGDGITDLAALYNYGTNNTGLFAFYSNGTTFTTTDRQWVNTQLDWNHAQLLAGDFDGTGRASIALIYDYGNDDTGIEVFAANGNNTISSTQQEWWRSGAGNWRWSQSKFAVGDFNGDGMTDLAALYDYGTSVGLWTIYSTGTSFNSVLQHREWLTTAMSWATADITAGDYNHDGKADVGVFTDKGAGNVGYEVWTSNGATFGAQQEWWQAVNNNWNWANVKIT